MPTTRMKFATEGLPGAGCVLGSSWPWATSCGSPVNGRFSERWNKGWELFFFLDIRQRAVERIVPH